MAYYAALTSVVELLEDILNRNRYPNFLVCTRQTISSLHKKLITLFYSLQDYSFKGDETSDCMERRIRDVACRAQEIIESGEYEEEDLEKLEREVDSIIEGMMTMKGSRRNLKYYPADFDASQEIPNMVGFDKYLTEVKEQLYGDSKGLQIIPIVGMAGIGKTTLAKHVFNSLIEGHFRFRVWITISQDYDLIRVLRNILQSLVKDTPNEPDEKVVEALKEIRDGDEESEEGKREKEIELKVHIHQYLRGRRFLMVVDDVWSTQVVDDMRGILVGNTEERSRILLTTRLKHVAKCASSTTLFQEINILNAAESWNLLRQKVFAQEHCPAELEDSGKSIANKCQGLPLVIVGISSIISDDLRQEHWATVASWDACSVLTSCTKLPSMLSRSFNHLSPQLKVCFLYMGSLQTNSVIRISTLTRLLIAEGFLRSVDESKTLEQEAEEWLEDLVHNNLVFVTKKRANGNFQCCKVNDIFEDFCRQRALREGFFHIENEKIGSQRSVFTIVRRANLYQRSPNEPLLINTGKYVGSIPWFDKTFCSNFDTIEWDDLKSLRVLGLYMTTTWSIPDAVLQMIHLKYLELLCLEHLQPVSLSPSLFALQNLQTLIIISPISIKLPPHIWKMVQLRHLIIGAMILPSTSDASDILVNKLELQTLTTVENFIFTDEAIGMVPNLRKLKVSCMGNEDNNIWEMYFLHNLDQPRQLEELKVIVDAAPFSEFDTIVSSFVFPLSLKKLSLKGCKFSWQDMTVVGSLPNLQVLRLRENSFVGEEWEPTRWEFLSLKFLLLEMLDLKYWRAEAFHFPRLEHLKINRCSELEGIPLEMGDGPSLKLIEVYASTGAGNSAKKIKDQQWDNGYDEPEIKIYGSGNELVDTEISSHI